MHKPAASHFLNDAGIAIGPMLFVVAIIAILATAIAAGSSTFNTQSAQEANRGTAISMIQLGQNLKMGIDRLVAAGTPIASIDISADNTTGAHALFSPAGGGMMPPSTALSNSGSDPWLYPWAKVTSMGTDAPERLAMLKVSPGICHQVNVQAENGNLTEADLGIEIKDATTLAVWPTGLAGKMVGCISSTNPATAGSYFYHVLAVQ